MTALTLIITSVAALDVSTGVREEKDHKHLTMTEADPMANHLDITDAGRSDCTSRIALGRTALASGAGCNTETNETCATKYEEKFRGDHRVGGTWTASLSLVGEVHLCEMRPAAVNGVNACMAGQVVTVCPEEEVVETSDGGAAGSATGASTVSAASTDSAATAAAASTATTANHCGRTLETNDCFELSTDICEQYWTADGSSDSNPYQLCGVVSGACDSALRYRPEWSACGVSNDGCFNDANGCPATAVSAAATTAATNSTASSSAASGTPNSCSQQLAITAFAAGTATVITTGMCEDQGLCTPTLAHCEAAAAEVSAGDNGRGAPSFGDEDRSSGSTCALCTWWAPTDVRTSANDGRRRHRTLLEYTYNAATGYNDCGATTNNGDDAGCVCVPC